MQGQVQVVIAYNSQLDKLVFLDTVQGQLEAGRPHSAGALMLCSPSFLEICQTLRLARLACWHSIPLLTDPFHSWLCHLVPDRRHLSALQAINISGRLANAIPLTPRSPLQNIPSEALVGGARPPTQCPADPLAGRNMLLKVHSVLLSDCAAADMQPARAYALSVFSPLVLGIQRHPPDCIASSMSLV